MDRADAHATRLWDEVLSELELHLDGGERSLTSATVQAVREWAAPAHLPALPRHLAARAQCLLERQQAEIARLQPLLAGARRQLQVGERIGSATAPPDTPVYIDVLA